MTGEDGALPAGGRFDRIEATLLRIEQKLDSKADREELVSIHQRIYEIETGEAPLIRMMTERFDKRLEDISAHGSHTAQETAAKLVTTEERLQAAVTQLATAEERLRVLEEARISSAAAQNTRIVQADRSTRFWTRTLTALTTLAVALSTATAIAVALH